MAFDLTLIRGGFGDPLDSPVMDYRRFYQMYYAVENRANLATANNWLAEMVTAFGPSIDTYAAFSKLNPHQRKRLLEFGRCLIERHVWSFMALGPRPPEQFKIDENLSNFARKDDREVAAIMMRSEFNHITERGDDPALCAIALTALGLPSTPTALFQNYDKRTARAVINFQRLYGSAFQSIVNADDNELDYQNVATGARFSAASRHDETFMQFMDMQAWMAEATFWHVAGTDLFDIITQLDFGSDALDATQAEALEMFKFLRGVSEYPGGNKRHLDLKTATLFAELCGHGFVPSMSTVLFGLTEQIALRDLSGNVIPGRIYIRAQAPVVGSHPQRDTWITEGQTFELVMEVPAGQTPDHVEAVVDVLQPGVGTRWFNFSGPVALDADTFTMTPVNDVGGKTRWTIDATKAAKWVAGENILGEFTLAQGPHLKASPANGIPVENISLLVADTAVPESSLYNVVPSRVLTGLQIPPTRTPLFAQRASGTLDNA